MHGLTGPNAIPYNEFAYSNVYMYPRTSGTVSSPEARTFAEAVVSLEKILNDQNKQEQNARFNQFPDQYDISISEELEPQAQLPYDLLSQAGMAQKVYDPIPGDEDFDFDVLKFIVDHGRHLSNWEKDLISIVREESLYFIPQIKTKIMNEGWASFWHYKILHELDLPQDLHIPFLKTHNQVIRPHVGRINPYNVGFYLFQKLEREKGLDFCFFVRSGQFLYRNPIAGRKPFADRKE